MRISRLELTNFKCFSHIVLENLGDRVVLVGPNGCGKSAILEAIAIVKEYVATYHPDHRIYHETIPVLGKYTTAWRNGIPLPIHARQSSAEIKINLTLNDVESMICGGHYAVEAAITINRSREVTATASYPSVGELLRSYDPESGIGIFDYIAPNRFYQMNQVTNLNMELLSIDRQRQERIELHNSGASSQKFANVKHFIISQQLEDTSTRNATGEDTDSLILLKDLFSFFFGPKQLIGYMNLDNQMKVIVRTPYGDHDIDELSSGEKELFTIFTNLFRIREFPGVILYDEPERHLNPGLESKLIPALNRLHTKNQLWISTHSTELIGSVPMREIIALQREAGSSQPERFLDDSKSKRFHLYESIGVSIGLQLASNRIVFLEGKQTHADKRILDQLASQHLPGVLFVASGASEDVVGGATRASLLLDQIGQDVAFMMVLDKDYRDDDSAAALAQKHRNNLFMWKCHELENLLIDAEIIWEVLKYNGASSDFHNIDDVNRALVETIQVLKDRFALEWATYRLHNEISGSSDGKPKDQASYLSMVRARREKFIRAYDVEYAQNLHHEAVVKIEGCLSDGTWKEKLPGKEILNQFRARYLPGVQEEIFKQQIVSEMLKQQRTPSEIMRLCEFVKAR